MSAPPARQASDVIVMAEAALPEGGRLRILRIDGGQQDGPWPAGTTEALTSALDLRFDADGEPDEATSIRDDGFELVAEVDGEAAGALTISTDLVAARLERLGIHPEHRGRGIAAALIQCARDLLAARGVRTLQLQVPDDEAWIAAWCRRHGFVKVAHEPPLQTWQGNLPILVEAPTAESMRALGERLAALLQPGDVIIATGDLGAGKTTLTQGIGVGLGIAGPVISPTFVLSRVHPGNAGRPALVHVDAYRLGSFDELEDLDLEASLADSVTLIEWGGGIAEGLSDDRLEIDIRRGLDPDDETRLVFLAGSGPRWAAGQLETLR